MYRNNLMPHLNYLDCNEILFYVSRSVNVKLEISDNLKILTTDIKGPVFNISNTAFSNNLSNPVTLQLWYLTL